MIATVYESGNAQMGWLNKQINKLTVNNYIMWVHLPVPLLILYLSTTC